VIAFFMQLGVTIRTDQKVARDFVMTHWTYLALFDVLEHRFARQFAFIFFRERFARTQNHVQQETGQIENDNEGDREDLGKDVARARTRVAKRPYNHGNPQGKQIRANAGDEKLQRRSQAGKVGQLRHYGSLRK